MSHGSYTSNTKNYVRTTSSMKAFKGATAPTSANGVAVGDFWMDTSSTCTFKMCTSIGPIVFATVSGGGTITLTGAVSGSGTSSITTTIADGSIANAKLANTDVANLSGTNTGDQTLPVVATGAEVTTGTDNAKFVSPKALADAGIAAGGGAVWTAGVQAHSAVLGDNTVDSNGQFNVLVGDIYSTNYGKCAILVGTSGACYGDYNVVLGNNCIAGAGGIPYCYAIGNNSRSDHTGSVVWTDSTGTHRVSTGDNECNLYHAGGLNFYTASINVMTAGFGLKVAEGSDAKQGTATLSGGTVTVTNASVTTNSRIFLTAQDNSSTGALRVSARTAGTSFTITSSNAGDSGVVAYEIFEAA